MPDNKMENEALRKYEVRLYQIARAKEYLKKHESNDGSESTLECCIISDLLRILKEQSGGIYA